MGLTKLTSRKDSCNAEREFLQGATVTEAPVCSDDIFGLSTDSLSRLRSPSVLEVREKGYERLKEELAKAQRVRKPCVLPSIHSLGMTSRDALLLSAFTEAGPHWKHP